MRDLRWVGGQSQLVDPVNGWTSQSTRNMRRSNRFLESMDDFEPVSGNHRTGSQARRKCQYLSCFELVQSFQVERSIRLVALSAGGYSVDAYRKKW